MTSCPTPVGGRDRRQPHSGRLSLPRVHDELRRIRRLAGNLIDAPSRRFAAGAQSIASALAAELPTGALRLDTPVPAIHPDRRTGGLTLSTPAGTLYAEHVVLALPPALAMERIDFGDALPADLVRLAQSTPVWMGAVAKVVARYPHRLLARGGAGRRGVQQDRPAAGDPRRVRARRRARRTLRVRARPHRTARLRAGRHHPATRLFGPPAATPTAVHVQNWSGERWTSPSTVQHLADYSLFGHPLYQRPALDGRLHWASTETATDYAGHIEGALAAGERAARAVPAASDDVSDGLRAASR
ncbi:FAD-dependent oxidoreductase [Streptomyces griseus]|uniref:flavin monoamine oxidase family protein n=1 Tax=Streptomyces griseus TaxID=1911 RepID=UPI00099C7FC0|nr:FAD-dependent oxidoreductase [Streptomyces griseus]